MIARLLLSLAAGYVLGCLVAAYYVTRWRRGVDIRASGSGNAGARNMARMYGPVDAVLTLCLDAAKGTLAVMIGLFIVGPEWAGAAVLAAAIVGHIWPAQLAFHGGKGAATGLGGMLALDPVACVALLAGGVAAYAVTRNFTASGLVAIGLSAPMVWLFGHDVPTLAVVAVASVLCLVVHHPIIDTPCQPRGTA